MVSSRERVNRWWGVKGAVDGEKEEGFTSEVNGSNIIPRPCRGDYHCPCPGSTDGNPCYCISSGGVSVL